MLEIIVDNIQALFHQIQQLEYRIARGGFWVAVARQPAALPPSTSTVADVSFTDLETLMARIQEVEAELSQHENDSGFCWHDVSRYSFQPRCQACESRIALLRAEMRMLYREMSFLLKEEEKRVVRHENRQAT